MPAFAADDDHDSGFYLGAGLGDFSADYHRPNDVTNQHLEFNRNDTERIFAGWRFTPYLSVQLDWSDYGRSSASANQLGLTTKSDALTPLSSARCHSDRWNCSQRSAKRSTT
jgi:hypothetical protein